ncbi:MAG: SEC-C motif-containing protein [Reinekea sp.]|jgi:SEC-C motif-containing protein|uniref:YchJ family protein n=1 Tax=Reinekea sp. TaxID=1970455 RepID=UPI0039893896
MCTNACPCGSTLSYQTCCARYHHQGMHAKTVEALMRSRYSAYVLCDAEYLMKTWTPTNRPVLDKENLAATQWLKLEVIQSKQGLKQGTVEFKAYYLEEGNECLLHEHSLFKKTKNRWCYVSALS